MANEDYRAEQEAARQHGLKARHELRLENATYTAAEVKVLTEAALRLGRKEAADEIAAYLDGVHEAIGDGAQRELFADLAETVRDIGKADPK